MSLRGALFGDPSIGTGEKLRAILNNMIPAFGVLFLGWETAPVLLLMWLDAWLGVWEIGAAACAEVVREDPSVIPLRIQGFRRRLYWGVTYLLFVVFASIPSFLAWMGLKEVTEAQYPDGLLSAALSGPAAALAVGLNVLLRGVQAFFASRRSVGGRMAFTLEEKYHLLAFKTLSMLFIASYFEGAGRIGLAAFVLLASAFFALTEMNPDRFLHLIKVGRGAADGEKKTVKRQGKERSPDEEPPAPEEKGSGPDPET